MDEEDMRVMLREQDLLSDELEKELLSAIAKSPARLDVIQGTLDAIVTKLACTGLFHKLTGVKEMLLALDLSHERRKDHIIEFCAKKNIS